MKRIVIATLAAGLLALAGCVHVHEHESKNQHERKGGPPPWAPAHGYRHKQPGPDLVFDAHIGVYVVVGHPQVYFHDGHYFRLVSSHWERCRNWEKGHWKTVDVAMVPDPLAKHYAKKGSKHGKGKAKGHGNGPAKHDD
jgi:hypothetical protein